jgi:D-lactate dehydrogenase (cytochrome)
LGGFFDLAFLTSQEMGFLVEETGTGAVAKMRAIKQALDPDDILNPGKILLL